MTLPERDVAIVIYSRNREACLARLLADLERSYLPCLREAGLGVFVCVYAQRYEPAFLRGLKLRFADLIEAGDLALVPARRTHGRIGDVALAAIRSVHRRCRYKLAMLMDDDSTYASVSRVDANIRQAARTFIAAGHLAYSIKLGGSVELSYGPFVDLAGPIMPFKEKMLWVSRTVLEDVLRTPRFAELSIGEDAVIAALAWLSDPEACYAVGGMGSFLHLSFERPAELGAEENGGGYADLMRFRPAGDGSAGTKYDEALRRGVTPHHIMPHVFVPEDHPHYEFNGVQAALMAARCATASRTGADEVRPPPG